MEGGRGLFAVSGALLVLAVVATLVFAGAAAFFYLKSNDYDAANQALQAKISAQAQKTAALEADIGKLRADYSALDAKLALTTGQLDESRQEAATLRAQIAQKEQELNAAQLDIEANKKKVEEIRGSLSTLDKTLNESIAWFRDNAALPESDQNVELYLDRVMGDCTDDKELNLACMSFLLDRTAVNLHYKTDIEKGKQDFLQPLNYTIARGGGDCEDYSLFIKATLNSLKKRGAGNLEATTFAEGGDSRFIVYPIESKMDPQQPYYYYEGTRKVSFGKLQDLTPYVVCYWPGGSFGHCTVALSKSRVESAAGMGALAGAYVYEPQGGETAGGNGVYLGQVGAGFSLCFAQPGENCYSKPNVIGLVIGDDDLYKYQDGNWVSYHGYYEKVGQIASQLG